MPLVDVSRVQPALGTLIGTVPLPEDVEQKATPSPGIMETIGAAFSADNSIVSAYRYLHDTSFLTSNVVVEPGYSAWNDIKGTPYEDHWSSFVSSNNRRYTNLIKARIDREEDDRRTLAAAGWGGTAAGFVASVLDPTILIPIGGEVAAAGKGSYAIGRASLRVGAAAGASTALQEGALQGTQETRTAEESAINIGASVVLGSLLGGGAALLTRSEQETAAKGLHGLVTGDSSVGAMQTPRLSTDDLTVAGDAANKIAQVTQAISPNMRLNQSPSAAARQIGQELAEGTMYQAMHAEGRTTGASVETLARMNYRARLAAGIQAHNDIFREMKQSAISMSRADFEEAVGRAMRAEDVGENDFVSRAAKSWRETIVDPYFNEAKAAGLMKEGDDVSFAPSYFPRQYNSKVLVANEAQIKAEWAAFMEGRVAADYAAQAETFRASKARTDTAIGDLQLPPKKRAARIAELEAEGARLDEANADHLDRVTRMGELRRTAREADGAGDAVTAAESRAEAARLAAEGGDDLKGYLRTRRTLRQRHLRLTDTPAGKAARDSRIAKLNARHAAVERTFYDRWEIGRLGQGIDPLDANAAPSFRDLAKEIVDDVFDKLTGKDYGSSASVEPEYLTPIARGPVKERTLPIPDEMLQRQGVLNDNVVEVLHRYARVLGADTELTARFGSPTMVDQLGKVRDEYRALREAAKDDLKELARLTKRESADVRDLQALRDLIRGTYKAAENMSTFGRVVRGASHMNYIRSMGGAVFASLSDLYRPAMVHGLGRYMGEGVAPLLKNLEAVRLATNEAKLMGQVTERVLQQRMVSLGEIADPMARGTPVERFLENGSKIASTWNGIQHWTDGIKAVTSILSQNRILDGSANRRTLAFLGIDDALAGRIKTQFAEHGEVLDGVHVANTERWTDPDAVRAFRAAVSKDVDSIIVTPGVGDTPLFSHSPYGRLILQFRSFMFASHQRVLLRGLQEDKAQFVSGLIGMTSLGMMAAVLKAWRGGNDRFEKFKDAAENPGYLIGEGLDNSGMFTLPFDIANTTEKLSPSMGFSFNPIKAPLLAAGQLARPGSSMQGSSVRFASRGPLGTLLGPSAGMLEQAFAAAGAPISAVKGDDATTQQKKAALGLIPYNSYPAMREMLQAFSDDSPYAE